MAHGDTACPMLAFELLAALPPRHLPRSFVSADAQETPFSYPRPAGLEACGPPTTQDLTPSRPALQPP